MLYTLNLYSAVCYLCLNKTEKKDFFIKKIFFGSCFSQWECSKARCFLLSLHTKGTCEFAFSGVVHLLLRTQRRIQLVAGSLGA